MLMMNINTITLVNITVGVLRHGTETLALLLRLGIKKPPAQFLNQQKNLLSVGRCPLVTSPVYGVSKKCNNQVVNRCTGSC